MPDTFVDPHTRARAALVELLHQNGYQAAAAVVEARAGESGYFEIDAAACRDSRDAREDALSVLQEACELGKSTVILVRHDA